RRASDDPRSGNPCRRAARGAGESRCPRAARDRYRAHPAGFRPRARARRARGLLRGLMQQDERGFRIAVVADDLVNSAGFDVLKVLERAGWGAIVLPPTWYPDEVLAEL